MALLIPIALFAVLFTLAYFRKSLIWFYRDYRHKVELTKRIYGQPTLPLIGNLHQIPLNPVGFGDYLIEQANIAAAKGHSLVRWWFLGKLAVMPVNGVALKDVLESSVEIKKGVDYDFYAPWLSDGLLLSHDEHWRAQRKMVTPVFHFAKLGGYVDTFNRHAKILADRLRPFSGQQSLVDIYEMVSCCTLDVIGEAMGLPLDTQSGGNAAYVKAVKDFNLYAYYNSSHPQYWLPFVWRWFGYGRQTERALAILRATSEKAVSDASKSGSNAAGTRHDFMHMLLGMRDQERLSLEDIQAQVDTFIFAGYDTTAHAISWSLWCLATHPDIQAKVHDEISAVCDATDDINSEQMAQLKYLELCVKEALRMFPPVPIIERLLRNDLEMDGQWVPAGTNLYISPYAVHHNAKIYPNAERYDPEEHFSEEAVAGRHSYDYIPFSAGPRNCIGQKFAWMEMKVVLAHVLREFRLETDYAFEENARAMETVLRPKMGIPVRLAKRAGE